MTKPAYRGSWRRQAERIIADHRRIYGNYCPGWGRTAHWSDDLVLDHDLGPLCRPCNSRKAILYDRPLKEGRLPRIPVVRRQSRRW